MKDNQPVYQPLLQELVGEAGAAFHHQMLQVEAAQRRQGGGQIFRLEHIDAGVVERGKSRDRWMVGEDGGWCLTRGADQLRIEWSLSVAVEDYPQRRDTRLDRSPRGKLWIVRSNGPQSDGDRIDIGAK